jgi:hypothetical protein
MFILKALAIIIAVFVVLPIAVSLVFGIAAFTLGLVFTLVKLGAMAFVLYLIVVGLRSIFAAA